MAAESLNLTTAAISWTEILGRCWPVAAISLGISLVATPLCRQIALKYAIVDKPDDFLKPHGRAIPYLGGVAIFLGWAAGILLGLCLSGMHVGYSFLLGLTTAGLAIMLIGLFDDLRVMRPTVKLFLNIAVAIFLVWMGLGNRAIHVATEVMHVQYAADERWLELVYSVPLALLVIVGACNATNLIDGLDGLCSGVLGIISVGFFILAVHLRTYTASEMADARIILALAMLGAAAGFLPFNVNPAKIFMGDAGSMLLGLNAAMLILLFAEAQLIRWMLGALMVFGLPIADMVLTLLRRWRNGRPLMQGDRSHFYDQLRDRGLSVRQVVAICYALTLGFVVLGILVIFLRTRYAILIYFLSVIAVAAALTKFKMVGIERDGGRPSCVGPEMKES